MFERKTRWHDFIRFIPYELNEENMKILSENIQKDMDSRQFCELEEKDFKKFETIYSLLDGLIENLPGKMKLYVLGEGTEEGTHLKGISTYDSRLEEEYMINNEIPLIIVTTEFIENDDNEITRGFALYPNYKVYMLEMLPN